jgi:hypothetical protein
MVICFVEALTPISVHSRLSYGQLQGDDVDIVVKPKDRKKLAILSDRINEKQVFKKNMNF